MDTEKDTSRKHRSEIGERKGERIEMGGIVGVRR